MKDPKEMTVKECKVELGKLQVAFKSDAKVDELRALVSSARDRQGLGIHPANDPLCEIFGSPKANNTACAQCASEHGKRNEACLQIHAESQSSSTGKVTPEKRQTVKARYADFGELKESIQKADDSRLTMYIDKLLVAGGKTPQELVKAAEDRSTEKGVEWRDFKNVGIIKKHLKYRASKGWVFTIFKNGTVKATDYAFGAGQIIDKAAEETPAEESKAA